MECSNFKAYCTCVTSVVPRGLADTLAADLFPTLGRATKVPYLRVIDGGA
jgi:hypothetical protein